MTYTVDKIIAVLKNKKYIVYDNDVKNYNLNIVGIRSDIQKSNSFDDLITVFWRYQGKWELRVFPCTTDPGTFGLVNPQNPNGTGILKEGQYIDTYKIDLHQGKYEALCQRLKPVTAIRDFDKDDILDFYSPDLTKLRKVEKKTSDEIICEWYDSNNKLMWRETTGFYGINIHRANENGKSVQVDKWSLACQVSQNRHIFNPDNQSVKVYEFDYFMNLCKKKVESFKENKFSYTLINARDFANTNAAESSIS